MGQYRFAYHPENVYGHVVRLLDRHVPTRGVHLDIGCGFGAIAEPLTALGFTYIGLDMDKDALTELRERGFEAILCDLSRPDGLAQHVLRTLDGRRVSSVTMLDIIEHVVDPLPMMAIAHDIALAQGCVLVTSVPNTGHHDLGVKLLTGRWDYTPTGLLDQTHLRFFTHESLGRLMQRCGWEQFAADDFRMAFSDQCFPRESVVLSRSTVVGQVLRELSAASGRHSATNQFIRAYRPVVPQPVSLLSDRGGTRRHALSVIVRIDAEGEQAFRDHMAELAAQTLDDFEVVICAPEVLAAVVSEVVTDLHDALRARVSVHLCPTGAESAVLRDAIAGAGGKYVAMLASSSRVLAHWVETFMAAMGAADGRVIQAGAGLRVSQPAPWPAGVNGRHSPGLPSVCPAYDPWSGLDRVPLAVSRHAVPWHFCCELGEGLDWASRDIIAEIIVSASVWCGVLHTDEVTSVEHAVAPDQTLADRLAARLDARALMLPPGSYARVAALADSNRVLTQTLLDMTQSRSWRLTRPLRQAVTWVRRAIAAARARVWRL